MSVRRVIKEKESSMHVKTSLAIIVGGLVILAGCASTPTSAPVTTASAAPLPTRFSTTEPSVRRVPPEKQDETFQAALARRNLTVADDPATTVQYGRIVCERLASSEALAQLIGEIQSTAGLDPDDAGYVLGASAAVYCPEQLPKLPSQ